MKKIILLLAVSVCMCRYATAQSTDDLSGRYYDEYGTYLAIDNGNFKLIIPNDIEFKQRYFGEMASGTVKRIDESFIELNSYEAPVIMLGRSRKITQTTVSELKDSIDVKFTIPYKYDKLKITLYTNNFKPYEFEYSTENTTIRIPNTVKFFSLYVAPELLEPHSMDGTFYGIMGLLVDYHYPVDEGANHIEVEIPAMDNYFFQRYYVVGEYARVTKNSITWKGITYYKATGRELKRLEKWEREEKERREQIKAGLKGK